jgi:hypothetical protein
MARFRNNNCIAFSRKWFVTDINEHYDSAGRDNYGHTAGKSGQTGHEVGQKPFKYPAQCIFFGKMKDTGNRLTVTNLCTTVQDWLLDPWGKPWNIDGTGGGPQVTVTEINANTLSCQYRHGKATTLWQDKTRSWRIVTASNLGERTGGAGFTPSAGTEWPAVTSQTPQQEGRRLDANASNIHEFVLPDGTTFWDRG